MKFLSNKISIVFICLMSFVISGLIFTDRVLGVTVKSNMDMYYGKIINLGTPTNSNDAATKNYVDSAFTGGSFSWSKLTGFPSACSSGQYVSGVGSSLTCSMPSSVWTSSGSNIYSNNSGYVGIGNSSPSYKLDVSGTINASNALCINGTCKNAWDSVTNYWTSSGSNIYSNNSGYVGIGNSSPSYKLDVSGTINALNAICISGTCKNTWNDPWSNLTNFPSSCSSGQYVSGVGSSLTCSTPSTPPSLWTDYGSYIYPNNYSSFVVTDSGYVGIGNSSPSYKLDVSGTGNFSDRVRVGNFFDAISSGVSIWVPFSVWSNITTNGQLSANSLLINGNSTLSGNVGIGNSNPSYKLDVSGTINASNALCISGTCKNTWNDPWSNLTNFPSSCSSGQYVSGVGSSLSCSTPPAPPSLWTDYGSYIYPNNYSSFVVTDSGYVGIGNSSPSYKLDVSGDTRLNGNVGIGTTPNSSYPLNVSGNSYLNGYVGIGTTPSTSYRLYVYGNSYLSGGVGIGTTPSSYYDLNVNNKVNAGGYLQNGTLTAPWFFSPTGNGVYPSNYSSTVFIGQSGAYTSDKLSVYGNVGVNGDIKAGSVKADYLNIYYNATISGNLTVNGSVNSVVKNFVINHPLDPENKKLIHSSLEGPEIAVFYRGEAQLQNGKAEVVLPAYFEALTRKDGRTVLLTPKFDSDELISQLAASAVENGKFKVKATDSQNPNQKFYWEVKAVRADIAPLEVERLKTENERKAESEK